MNNKNILLHLSLIDGISSATVAQLVVNKPNAVDLADMYSMSEQDLMHQFGVSYQIAAQLKAGLAHKSLLETELMLIEKHAIQWATVVCREYPETLKTIHLLPPVIYWRGTMLNNDEKSIAFVGSRGANVYGQHVVDQLVPPLVEHGYAIISGGALGADSMAHRAAVNHGGKTIAVLGAGLLMPYLVSNRQLFEDMIANHGVVMSSFPLREQAFPANFPARNRIIAGLSRGTVVVQAAAKSGALITARFALDQGRDVFAVPGPIHDPLSAGCHGLISQGATLVTSASDILTAWGEVAIDTAVDDKKVSKAKKGYALGQMPLSALRSPIDVPDCEPKGIIDTTPAGKIERACVRPCSMDDLAVETGFEANVLRAMLFDLQLEGRVKQNFMGMWERTR